MGNSKRPKGSGSRPRGGRPGSRRGGSSGEPAGGGRADRKPSYPGSELLSGASPQEVLDRILEGDPLGVQERCGQRVQERALLIDLNRLFLRSLARIAHAAPDYAGNPSLAAWLSGRIDRSIEELVAEDYEEERRGIAPQEPWDPRYALVSEALGIDMVQARRVCIAFNDLPDEVRLACFAVLIEGKTINRYVAEGHGPPERVKELLQRGAQALSQARDDDGEDSSKGGQP